MGVAALVAMVYFRCWGSDTAPEIKIENTPVERSAQSGLSFAPVVKRAAPSVVNIYSTTIIRMKQRYGNPFFNDPFFRQFFGDQAGPGGSRVITRRQESLGSGVIVSPDGYILTANHVVQGATEISVKVQGDSKKYKAKVIGTDPLTDIAVLKIDASNLPAITLGDSSQLEVGDIVLAIGNPFGVGQTVTMGIVSALGRTSFPFDEPNSYPRYKDFIQTDAAINPGNSGGALVDADGRLVGINTMIITSESIHGLGELGGNEGIGFAVPIDLARNVMEQLIRTGKVVRGYLGARLGEITPALAQDFNLPNDNGVLVNDVAPNGPAQNAGIQSGDVIVGFNNRNVTDPESLSLAVSECAPGSKAAVKVIRDGKEKTFTVKLGELPNQVSKNELNQKDSSANSTPDALDGVTVSDLDQEGRQELGIPANIQGALVTEVDRNSNSAEAGLQQGDVIVEINHHPVSNAEDAVRLCTQAKTSNILLKVWRQGNGFQGTVYIAVDNTKQAE